MTSKQTSVEWLVEQLEQHHTSIDIKNTVVFQQAKAMEKQQIIDAYHINPQEAKWKNIGINYYNETFLKD